jgi:hypothetical protein
VKVHQLLELLSDCHPDLEVVIRVDSPTCDYRSVDSVSRLELGVDDWGDYHDKGKFNPAATIAFEEYVLRLNN